MFLFIYFIILVIFVERGWNGSTTRRRRGGSGKRFFVRVGDGLLPFIMVAVRKVAKLVVIDCARERKRDRCVIHRLWSPNSNKKYSIFEHKWQQNLDLPMQCERSTISRQLKFGRRLRVLIDVEGLGRPKEFTGREENLNSGKKDGGVLRWARSRRQR